MDTKRFKEILSLGETICTEFKRCGNGVESDVYETVCSFLNRFGGDIFLGVEDNGQVSRVPAVAVLAMIKNFIACVSNPALFTPTVYTDETVNAPIECTDAPVKCTDQLETGIDRKVVEFMQKNPRISFIKLTEATGFSRRAIAVHVKS